MVGACQIFAEYLNEMDVATGGLGCFLELAGRAEIVYLLSHYKLNDSGYLCTCTCYMDEVVIFSLDA